MRTSLFLTLILPGTILSAQVKVNNLSLTDSIHNVFYIGVDNPIRVEPGRTNPAYVLSIEGGGQSISVGKNEYVIRVNAEEDCHLIITTPNKKLLLDKVYNVLSMPPFKASLNGFYDTTVSKREILLNPILTVIQPGCFFKFNSYVISFQATFIKNGDSTFTSAEGHNLSNEQLKLIEESEHGDKIWFNHIRMTGPDDWDRGHPNESFWIKVE